MLSMREDKIQAQQIIKKRGWTAVDYLNLKVKCRDLWLAIPKQIGTKGRIKFYPCGLWFESNTQAS